MKKNKEVKKSFKSQLGKASILFGLALIIGILNYLEQKN